MQLLHAKSVKNASKLYVFFALLGSGNVKVSQKTLVKTAPSVNFINILCSNFSYESAFCCFSLIKVWLCDFLAKEYWCKSCL